MPVTARLSRKFYETFGDEIANELQRLAQQDVRWEGQLTALGAELRTEMAELRAELRREMAELRAEFRTAMAAQETRLRTAMADQRAELHRSLSRYWAGTVIPLAGLIIALFIRG
jgi:hypothetical protein